MDSCKVHCTRWSGYYLFHAFCGAAISTVFFSVALMSYNNEYTAVKTGGMLISYTPNTGSKSPLAWFGINGYYLSGVTAFQLYKDCANTLGFCDTCESAGKIFFALNIVATILSAVSFVATFIRIQNVHNQLMQYIAFWPALVSGIIGIISYAYFRNDCMLAIVDQANVTVYTGIAMNLTLAAVFIQIIIVSGVNFLVSTKNLINGALAMQL